MEAEMRIAFRQAVFDCNAVTLLKADAIPGVVEHTAILDPRAVTAIEEDARSPATREVLVVFPVPLNLEA